jgi:glucokinase
VNSWEGDSFIGVDIGGTKVAAAVVTDKGEIRRRSKSLMSTHGTAAEGVSSVVRTIDAVLENDADLKRSLRGIGICSPGPLDPRTGVIINPPNLPCWRNFPLAQEISRMYGVPVKVDNDANAAALAEGIWGAGRGYQNVFFAILGTGVGTGILLDRAIYYGRTGAAAEGGHMSIDYKGPRCGCGKLGCAEALLAGPAIARRAHAKLVAGQKSSLLELAGGNAENVTSEMVGQAYSAGDAVAREVLMETVELLAVWLGNIVDLLEPDVMILGGGASAMLKPLFGEVRDRLPRWCINTRCREIPMVSATYGNDAGIAGGAALVAQLVRQS